jgi:hypothetical protein
VTNYKTLFGDRALDAEVAEVVFGARVWIREGFEPGVTQPWMACHSPHQELPHYSTDRGDAMAVFFECLMKFGQALISGDMEDYGREPGDIVTISFGFDDEYTRTRTGPLAQTMCELAIESYRKVAAMPKGSS